MNARGGMAHLLLQYCSTGASAERGTASIVADLMLVAAPAWVPTPCSSHEECPEACSSLGSMEFGPLPCPDGWAPPEQESLPADEALDGSRFQLVGKPVKIQQGGGGIVGTGCVVSASAVTLVDFLQSRNVLGDVLELGSGTGIVAIGAAMLGGRVVATDVPTNPHGFPEAAMLASDVDVSTDAQAQIAAGRFTNLLDVVQFNIDQNSSLINSSGGAVEVMELLWGSEVHMERLLHACPDGFDHILGCNITYQTPSYQALAQTIRFFSAPRTKTYIATSLNLGDNSLLETAADDAGLQMKMVQEDVSSASLIFELSLREKGADYAVTAETAQPEQL